MISLTQGIIIQAIFFYFIYGLASAVLGFWWARESIRKTIQKREAEGITKFVFLIILFFASVVIWPYILCATIKSSITRKNESLK